MLLSTVLVRGTHGTKYTRFRHVLCLLQKKARAASKITQKSALFRWEDTDCLLPDHYESGVQTIVIICKLVSLKKLKTVASLDF
jgi:hypothetical protein